MINLVVPRHSEGEFKPSAQQRKTSSSLPKSQQQKATALFPSLAYNEITQNPSRARLRMVKTNTLLKQKMKLKLVFFIYAFLICLTSNNPIHMGQMIQSKKFQRK